MPGNEKGPNIKKKQKCKNCEGNGTLKLYENGIEVEKRPVLLKPGATQEIAFTRTPSTRNTFQYRAVLEGITGDTLPGNDSALAIVDVRGRLRLLYIESDASEAESVIEEALTMRKLPTKHGNIPIRVEGKVSKSWEK